MKKELRQAKNVALCHYMLTGFRSCQKQAHYVRIKKESSGVRLYQYLCSEHSTADSISYPSPEAATLFLIDRDRS